MTDTRIPLAIDFDSTAWPFLNALGAVPETPTHADGSQVDQTNCFHWDVLPELFGATRANDPDFFDKDGIDRMLAAMDAARSAESLRRHGLFDGFAEAIRALQTDGYRPLILSDISETSAAAVEAYLAECGIEIELVRCKGRDKAQWCLDNGSPLLVDDSPETIADAAAKGLPLLTFPWPFNQEALAAAKENSTVVEPAGSWQPMLAAIREQLDWIETCTSLGELTDRCMHNGLDFTATV